MAYTSLYRRFRPDTFDKVIGQEHIVKTLINQLKNKAVGHAYLFTGTRGTGKTSVAKIFARAVNCENPINGSPCGKCRSCLDMKLSTNFDVLELDAASNNGVDQIRELNEKINYAPSREGAYKVYIIDEVHMLTPSAYNALLKTLEEPPKHAIFILCTTEVHKIAQTIMSRCLRFDFRLIPTTKLIDHLKYVYTTVGVKYEEDALSLIATAGAGSARDTLSIADMCLSYCGDIITYKGALEVLGQSDPLSVIKLTTEILNGNLAVSLESVARICDQGKNVAMLASDIAEHCRNMIFIKKCTTANKYLGLPASIFEALSEAQKNYSVEQLLKAITIFTSLEGEFRYSSQQRILFEAAIVKVAVGEPKQIVQQGVQQVAVKQVSAKATISEKEDLNKKANQLWGCVISSVVNEIENQDSFLKFAVSEGEPKIEDNKFIVYFTDGQPYIIVTKPENKAFLKKIIMSLTKMDFEFRKKITLNDDTTKNYMKTMFGDDVTIK